jgi:hypothetical protein
MSNVTFEVSAGKVLRNGEAIADYDESGKLDFYPDKARFRAPVVAFLKSMDLPVETGTVTKKENKPVDAPAQAQKPSQDASEEPGEEEVAKAMEVLRKAGKAPAEAAPVVSSGQVDLEKRLTEKVVGSMSRDPILDPQEGRVRS